MEQYADPETRVRHYTRIISSTQNAFIWSVRDAATSSSVLCAVYKFDYLLTYLHEHDYMLFCD